MTFCANAQNAPGSPSVNAQNPRYRLVDLGTFGGPASHFPNGYDGILNNHGTAVGWSEAVAINDRGEIAGFGVPPGCAPQNYGDCGHA